VSQLQEISDQAAAAATASEQDPGASPVLIAVVREFANKAAKAVEIGEGGREWEAMVEVEQAADSAKAAVEADAGASESTTKIVQDAHLAICKLKGKTAKARA
jgi:hypothetical protein